MRLYIYQMYLRYRFNIFKRIKYEALSNCLQVPRIDTRQVLIYRLIVPVRFILCTLPDLFPFPMTLEKLFILEHRHPPPPLHTHTFTDPHTHSPSHTHRRAFSTVWMTHLNCSPLLSFIATKVIVQQKC